MKEILNNEFASVSYDSASHAIIAVWKKPSTSEAYRLIFSAILDSFLINSFSSAKHYWTGSDNFDKNKKIKLLV